MGGTAPANQLRLSFTGSDDGEAETETCRAAKPLWRTTTRTLRPARAQLAEPPYADPHVRWCGRGGRATFPPMPIGLRYQCPRSVGWRMKFSTWLGNSPKYNVPATVKAKTKFTVSGNPTTGAADFASALDSRMYITTMTRR